MKLCLSNINEIVQKCLFVYKVAEMRIYVVLDAVEYFTTVNSTRKLIGKMDTVYDVGVLVEYHTLACDRPFLPATESKLNDINNYAKDNLVA